MRQPTAWPVPNVCASHFSRAVAAMTAVLPLLGLISMHGIARRVYERANPCLKDPLLPGRVQNTPLRASEMKTK